MDKFIRMETERLIIRDHIIEDLDSHHLLFSDETIMYYLQDIQTTTMEESKSNLLNAIEEICFKDRRKYFFRIENKVTKAHIGEVGYTVTYVTPLGKVVHMGYFIHQDYWNKGYVTEAVKEVIRFAFEENDVFRISTGCIKDNLGSERVMQKCDMIQEAEFRMIEWHDGRMKDRLAYRLIKNEWIDAKRHDEFKTHH